MRTSVQGAAVVTADLGVKLDGSVPFSVDGWVRLDALTPGGAILEQVGVFSLSVSGTNVVATIGGQQPLSTDATVSRLDDQDWHFVSLTYSPSQTALYLDGLPNVKGGQAPAPPAQSAPSVMGAGLSGMVRAVRIYNAALSPQQVLVSMYNDPAITPTAAFDYSVSPPVGTSPSGPLAIALDGDAAIVTRTPALALADRAYAVPVAGEIVNPGGWGHDAYTVQSWIWLDPSTADPEIVVFTNGDLGTDTGIVLELRGSATAGYNLVTIRGPSTTENIYTSTTQVPLGAWTNVATTFDGTTVTLYIGATAAGEWTAPPIAAIQPAGDPLVGGSRDPLDGLGQATLQGYIARTDIWSLALSPHDLATYAASTPATDASGLVGAWDFSTPHARDLVSGHPVAMADGAVLAAQEQPGGQEAALDRERAALRAERALPPLLSPEEVTALRATIDIEGLIEDIDLFEEARKTDLEFFEGDPATQRRLHEAYDDVLRTLREDPESLPFLISDHEVGDQWIVVSHTPTGSEIVLQTSNDLDPIVKWYLLLLCGFVAGALSVGLGVQAKGDPVTTIALRDVLLLLLTLGPINSALSTAASPSATAIWEVNRSVYDSGYMRPLLQGLLDFGIWATLRMIARWILRMFGAAWADIIVALAGAVAGIIQIYRLKPKQVRSQGTVRLDALMFTWDSSSTAACALPLRHDYRTPESPIQRPAAGGVVASVRAERPQLGAAIPEPNPVLYSLTRVAAQTPRFRARFNTTVVVPHLVTISATSNGGILGDIPPTPVPFAGGTSGWVELPLTNPRMTAATGVSRQEMMWLWTFQSDQPASAGEDTSVHTVYTVITDPGPPWHLDYTLVDPELPWVTALDCAIDWIVAQGGATTAAAAAAAITRAVYTADLTYVGGSQFATPNGWFNVTGFVAALDAASPAHPVSVNCTDCASIVVTMANLVGARLTSGDMRPLGGQPGFSCNPIQAVGLPAWAYPFGAPGGGSFSYHEVAAQNVFADDFPVWDACLSVDSGANPWVAPAGPHGAPVLPIAMAFSTRPAIVPVAQPAQDYRERLATNDATGVPLCQRDGFYPGLGAHGGVRFVF